jgi:hypothetical protein
MFYVIAHHGSKMSDKALTTIVNSLSTEYQVDLHGEDYITTVKSLLKNAAAAVANIANTGNYTIYVLYIDLILYCQTRMP